MARCDYLDTRQDMKMATSHVVRTKGSIPSRYVPRKKARGATGIYRTGNYGVLHGEPEHGKIDDFMMFCEPDDDEDSDDNSGQDDGGYIALRGIPQHSSHSSYTPRRPKSFSQTNIPVSYNFVDFVTKRAQGLNRGEHQTINEEFGTRHMLTTLMFKEKPISLNRLNKVFCSQWLSDHQIVMGTKCNRLMVYDINNQVMDRIPNLISSDNIRPPDQQSGIHSIEINPSKSLLATTAQNSKDVAIYKLPTLDPVCVGEKGHSEWVLDMAWLDDEFLVSCSMDTKLALWRIDEDAAPDDSEEVPNYAFIKPVKVRKCFVADKLRAVIFNPNLSEIVTLSMNAYIHVWDSNKFCQKMSRKLPHGIDNVCLTRREDCSLYAIGSKSHFTLLDPRTLHHVRKVNARISGSSVRSLSFHGDILTIGTGTGIILFYDMRAGKYMDSSMNSRAVMLKCSKGWINVDENFHEVIHNNEYSPAIYTHCYDWSGIRLFAAGGPSTPQLKGNYAALWL